MKEPLVGERWQFCSEPNRKFILKNYASVPANVMLDCFLPSGSKLQEEADNTHLSVAYKGWVRRHEVSGTIQDLSCIYNNRNGNYRLYRAEADKRLHIKIKIEPI